MSSVEPIAAVGQLGGYVQTAAYVATAQIQLGAPVGNALGTQLKFAPSLIGAAGNGSATRLPPITAQMAFSGNASLPGLARVDQPDSSLTPSVYDELKRGFRQLDVFTTAKIDQIVEAQTQLALRVDALTRAIGVAVAITPQSVVALDPPAPAVELGALTQADAEGQLGDALDKIADDHLRGSEDVVAFVVASLRSEDPEVRAAAARALSSMNPSMGQELLPSILAAETNRFAAAIIRGALSACA